MHANCRDILFGLAESFYQQGQYAEAIVYYQRLLGEFPDEPSADDAQYNMAWCLIELKREEQAMQAFRTLLARYPQSEFAASVQFTFGDYAYNRGDYEEAMRLYLLVQERFPAAEVASQVPRLVAELREAIAYERYEQGIALMDSAEVTKETQYYQAGRGDFSGCDRQLSRHRKRSRCAEQYGSLLGGAGEMAAGRRSVRPRDSIV